MKAEKIEQLLTALQAPAQVPPGHHLTDADFVACMLEEMAPEQAKQVEAHLAACPQCPQAMEAFFTAAETFPQAEWAQRRPTFVQQLRAYLQEAQRPAAAPQSPGGITVVIRQLADRALELVEYWGAALLPPSQERYLFMGSPGPGKLPPERRESEPLLLSLHAHPTDPGAIALAVRSISEGQFQVTWTFRHPSTSQGIKDCQVRWVGDREQKAVLKTMSNGTVRFQMGVGQHEFAYRWPSSEDEWVVHLALE